MMEKKILAYASKGNEVSDLQFRLSAIGYGCGDDDGFYGVPTVAAVRAFQSDKGLPPTGEADSATLCAIAAIPATTPTDDVRDFIRWALTHAKAGSIPLGAELLIPAGDCGTDPWEYLFGTSGKVATSSVLEERWRNYYSLNGWRRKDYDRITRDWAANRQMVADCQGLLDAYCTMVLGIRTDLSAHGNYTKWCSEKGRIAKLSRPYVIGEAVFRASNAGIMKHVGWVCGFTSDGEPLVVEERGLSYGCVVTRLSVRNWTHRGIMDKRFVYASVPSEAYPYFAVCGGNSVHVRSGRGTKHNVLATLRKGDLLLALPPIDGWCEITYVSAGTFRQDYMSAKYVASKEVV